MTVTENANVAEILRAIGWNDTQIIDFILGVEGRISIEETARRYNDSKNEEQK